MNTPTREGEEGRRVKDVKLQIHPQTKRTTRKQAGRIYAQNIKCTKVPNGINFIHFLNKVASTIVNPLHYLLDTIIQLY